MPMPMTYYRANPPEKLSQKPGAIRMRRWRRRQWTKAVALPPRDITPDIVQELRDLDWLGPNEMNNPKAISDAVFDLAREALKAGARRPGDGRTLVAMRMGPKG